MGAETAILLDDWPTPEIISGRRRVLSVLEQMYKLPYVVRQYNDFEIDISEMDYSGYFDDVQRSLKYLSVVSANGYVERILNHAIMQDSLRFSRGLYNFYIDKDLRGGANPNMDRIKGILKSINPDINREFQNFLNRKHTFQPPADFTTPRRVISNRESLQNRLLFDDYLSKYRNHVAHSRNLHEFDADEVNHENIIDMVEFAINMGKIFEDGLNPNNKWTKVGERYHLR